MPAEKYTHVLYSVYAQYLVSALLNELLEWCGVALRQLAFSSTEIFKEAPVALMGSSNLSALLAPVSPNH